MGIDDFLYEALEIVDLVCIGEANGRQKLALRDLLRKCSHIVEVNKWS